MEGNLSMLYESGKEIVWVVVFRGSSEENECSEHMTTAFVVGKDGLLMTCAQGEWNSWSNLEIKCRSIGMSELKYKAKVVLLRKNCDMCLLKVSGIQFCYVGKFANGNLSVGDSIMQIGNPYHYIGWGVKGNVTYPCIENAIWDYRNEEICYDYICESKNSTPDYLIMGNVWNKRVFEDIERTGSLPPDVLETNLLANIPIILCTGLMGEGAGSPILNLSGEIVGMMSLQNIMYEVGIHVSAIKKFIELAVSNSKEKNVDVDLVGSSKKKSKKKKI